MREFKREFHVNLASLKFDTGFAESRVLLIRRGSEVNLVSKLQYLDNFQIVDYCIVSFAVRYSLNPLSKKCHFGQVGGADTNMIFVLQRLLL